MNFSGYSNDKPSSRVLNPPGGRSNNIFGAYEEPAAPVNRNKQSNVLNDNSNINGNQSYAPHETPAALCKAAAGDRTKSNIVFGDDHSSVPVNKPRSGYNPITGRPYQEEDEERRNSNTKHVAQQAHDAQEKATHQQNQQPEVTAPPGNYHSSTRIHHPPGGKSTKLW